MKLFLGLLGSLVVATALVFAVYYVMPGATNIQWQGRNADWVGNLSFALFISAFVLRVRSVRLLSVATVLAVPAFLAVVAGIVFLGLSMFERSPVLAVFMMSAVGTIGSYPAGADMPFDFGIRVWAATALIPIGIGLLLGASARKFRRT